ncbi:hypothetical protein C8R48DRAFT_781458 [Suillus tomentosus]|nr:hypothetical protein C8R48DRAFT_781458 [Suillus tomentosus]
MWDVANIFEYVAAWFTAIRLSLDNKEVPRTSAFRKSFVRYLIWEAERFVFPFINICTTSNTCPALPDILSDIVNMLTGWQMALSDDDELFKKFATHNFNTSNNLMARYRAPANLDYHWWNNRFDLIPFAMPSRISLDEVMELRSCHDHEVGAGQLLLPDMHRHDTGPNPVLNNLRAVCNQMQDLGNALEDWLAHKMADGEEALEVMARLEALVDDLHDAIAAAQQLLDTDGN